MGPRVGLSSAKLLFGHEIRTKIPSIASGYTATAAEEYACQSHGVAKLKGKDYTNDRRNASKSHLERGDQVLLKQNNLTHFHLHILIYKKQLPVGHKGLTYNKYNSFSIPQTQLRKSRLDSKDLIRQDEDLINYSNLPFKFTNLHNKKYDLSTMIFIFDLK